jgi:cell division protein FtsI (penicillin-binding protein 3)
VKNQRPVTFNHNPLLEQGLPAWRPRVILLCLLAGSLALAGRAAYLQGFNNEFLQAQGESRYSRVIPVPATRGRIADRNGDVLAISTPVRSIWAIPSDAALSPADTRQLAALLETDVQTLNARLASERDFVFLRRQVPPEVARRVAELRLPGIHQQQEYRRYYPGGEVTAHMLGFTSVDDRGQEGVELAFDEQLKGRPGSRRVIRDRRGQIIEDVESIRLPQDGKDLVLSIDKKIQFIAYSALREAVEKHKAYAGSVVVLDARTGEILALVNAPTFNPNNRSNLSGAQLRNRALTDVFEPGSMMKPFVAALALDYGKVRADTLIDIGNGRMTMGRATISDVRRPKGPVTVAGVVKTSSNVGTVKMAMQFEPEEMWRMFDTLGIGTPLSLGFPGEAGGRLRPARSWRPIEQATMSYGYGLSSTLMHMARAYTVFTRDGELMPLSLIRLDTPPQPLRRVFSSESAQLLREMLEQATEPEGTGGRAQVAGYRVAGKTGTAHKLEGGRYTDKYISSFVGFAPVSNPRLIIAVMIDEPRAGQHFGGAVAAPVFARITEGALRTLGVAPDAPLAPLHFAGQNGIKPVAAGGSL